MSWTIARRIALALALELALLAVVAFIASRSLASTSEAYENGMAVRRDLVARATLMESEVRGANVEQLRFLLDGDPRYVRTRDSVVNSASTLLTALQAKAQSITERNRWQTAGGLLARWRVEMERSQTASEAGKRDDALRIRRINAAPIRDSLDALVRVGVIEAQQLGDSLAQIGFQRSRDASNTVLVGAVIALLVGLTAGYLVSRSINRPLQESATVIATSSAEILAATTEQAAGTNESMAAVTETVATVDEVAQTAQQSAQRARAVADSAQRAAEAGRAGRQAVNESVNAMQLVQEQVEAMAKSIVALAQQAQTIGEITTAVSDIAEQTKLLALNAAVESTRAGEHGRGFALVAAEIKTLAGEAKESTGQVRRLLADIQRATSAAVMATEQGTKQTDAAVRQVRQAGDIMAQLAVVVDESAQAAAQIGASAGQQALGMDQIRQAISNIHDATQQSLTATRQSETAAQNLNQLGTRLVELVGARAR